MMRFGLALILTLSLSACATPETRIKTALTDAGLSNKMAGCMAERMVDRLSLLQLNKLRGLQKLKGADAKELSMNDFIKRTKSLQDPEILSVVTTSGVVCTFK
jgi:protein gp37